MHNWCHEAQISYAFFIYVRKWKSGMGYCLISIHNVEPKIHFYGWKCFIWKYIVTFQSVRRAGVRFEILVTKSDKRRKVAQKQLIFSVTLTSWDKLTYNLRNCQGLQGKKTLFDSPTPHSICLNINFLQSSFVWKC